ncbi:MAG: fasciclin domain-containing protein, partial [Planctomycetes bacterium]|nr:fasciclin domain-containing protein [Planctomycetota bacterium]
LGKDTITDLLKPENKARLAKILKFHVVAGNVPAKTAVTLDSAATIGGQVLPLEAAGENLTVGGAKVVAADVAASNGVIHVIDSVMIPGPNLVEVAQKAGSFGTLLAAAKAAGLAETLADGGPFTVFAPTDAAFDKLGKDTITDLLKPENKAKLAAILKFHVVAGNVPAKAAVKLDGAETIGGKKLGLALDGKMLRVGGAEVVKADVTASNGVIHVIDTVLIPND